MLKKEKTKKIILLFGIVTLVILIFLTRYFLIPQITSKQNNNLPTNTAPPNSPPTTKIEQTENQNPKVFLEINNIRYESEIIGAMSVYDLMVTLRKEGKINFTEKNYIGIGKFIETINNLKNTGTNYWIYYINNQQAQVGISDYKIKPGDVVSWKYEKSIY